MKNVARKPPRASAARTASPRTRKKTEPELSDRQCRFVAEFLVDCDAGAAYRRAGYTAADPQAAGTRLLRRAEIVEAIFTQNKLNRSMRATADSALDPALQGALTVKSYGERVVGPLNQSALWTMLRSLTAEVGRTNLARGVQMLAVQAHTLDGIYNRLVRDALDSEWLERSETLFKLAFRAQSQSRATWETISLIQNPPVAGYVNQANIAHGHQQVNNGAAIARARDEKPPSKLLDQTRHEPDDWMDRRAPQTTSEAHSKLEAVVEVDRTEDAERQGQNRTERVQGRFATPDEVNG